MTVRMDAMELVIHLEGADSEAVWWAESPQMPGFSAAAPTLSELRTQAYRAIRGVAGSVQITERLAELRAKYL